MIHLTANHNVAMAYQAQETFPDIDFSKSIMVGNRLSDMGFARNAWYVQCFFSNNTSGN